MIPLAFLNAVYPITIVNETEQEIIIKCPLPYVQMPAPACMFSIAAGKSTEFEGDVYRFFIGDFQTGLHVINSAECDFGQDAVITIFADQSGKLAYRVS